MKTSNSRKKVNGATNKSRIAPNISKMSRNSLLELYNNQDDIELKNKHKKLLKSIGSMFDKTKGIGKTPENSYRQKDTYSTDKRQIQYTNKKVIEDKAFRKEQKRMDKINTLEVLAELMIQYQKKHPERTISDTIKYIKGNKKLYTKMYKKAIRTRFELTAWEKLPQSKRNKSAYDALGKNTIDELSPKVSENTPDVEQKFITSARYEKLISNIADRVITKAKTESNQYCNAA